ncbi:MAG TPA: hypothetical protein VNQ73_02555 [Ilumatobacter sp.]|nr:hypothetical protein [Ilumatobacter sp.]
MTEPLRPFRVHLLTGDVEVMAVDHDDAERRARYSVSSVPFGTWPDNVGIIDRGETWAVVDLTEFPDDNFHLCCGRPDDGPHARTCRNGN